MILGKNGICEFEKKSGKLKKGNRGGNCVKYVRLG
jgi:hypothetical protein